MNSKFESKNENIANLNVGNFYCVGRNYAKHAAEMGGKTDKFPIIFLKPDTSYVAPNTNIAYPTFTKNLHHEVELVVVIGKYCHNVSAENAMDYVIGYGVGVDLTLRDLQAEAKNNGDPWDIAKGFYSSAPLSEILEYNSETNLNNIELELYVESDLRQKGNTQDMVHKVADIIAYLSERFALKSGDVIFTGTPEGVGAINKGEKVRAILNSDLEINFAVV